MNTTNDLITQNDYPSPSIFTEDGYTYVALPFLHWDYDAIYLIVSQLENGDYLISDQYEIFDHFSGSGVNNIYSTELFPEFSELFSYYGINNKNGELTLRSTKQDLVKNFYRFVEVIKQIVKWESDIFKDHIYRPFDTVLSTPDYLKGEKKLTHNINP